MEEVIKILQEIEPGHDYAKEDNLIEDEILDSFDIVNLVARLNNQFDIEIETQDVIPSNFKSAKAIYDLVERLED